MEGYLYNGFHYEILEVCQQSLFSHELCQTVQLVLSKLVEDGHQHFSADIAKMIVVELVVLPQHFKHGL